MAEGTQGNKKNYQRALATSLKSLTDNLDPAAVLVSLVSKGAITSKHKSQIQGKPTSEDRVEELVEILQKRKLEHYEMFMDILKEERDDLWLEVKSNEGGTSPNQDPPTGRTSGPSGGTSPNQDPPTGRTTGPSAGKIMTEEDLPQVAEIIGAMDNLLSFYIRLGMKAMDVKAAEQQANNPTDKAMNVLLEWLQSTGKAATRDKIKAAMVAMKKWTRQIELLEEAWNE